MNVTACMQFQKGDWVLTDQGRLGQILLVSRMSAFVEIQDEYGPVAKSYLLSTLAKAEAPESARRG